MSGQANLDGKSYALTGPMKIADPAHTPVRGDLAHIGLAGRYFVPHYAVPMPHALLRDADLMNAAKPGAEAIGALATGTLFNVLDVAGGWAWGQAGDDGLVGYLPLDALAAEPDERRS